MKGKYTTQLISLGVFFLLITLFKQGYRDVPYILFWLGGLIGIVLPDLDHVIYAYFLRPEDPSSKQIVSMIQQKQVKESINYMVQTGDQRKKLIFHSSLIQWVFLVFAFLVISSSSSLFGRGLVLAFLLHILIDQVHEFLKQEQFDSWFYHLSIKLDKEKSIIYIVIMASLLVFFGFLL